MYTRLTHLLVTVALLLFAQSVHGQTTDSTQQHSSLLFQIGSNFNLTNFQGSTFAYQRKIDEHTSNRFFISLNGRINFGDQDRKNRITNYRLDNNGSVIDTTTSTNESDLDAEQSDFDLSLGWIRIDKQPITKDVDYYLGFGLKAGYGYYADQTQKDITNEQSRGTQYFTTQESTLHSFNGGPIAIIGAEYSIGNNLTLLAEYGLELLASYQTSKVDAEQIIYQDDQVGGVEYVDSKTTDFQIALNSLPVKFGVRFNF